MARRWRTVNLRVREDEHPRLPEAILFAGAGATIG
jgi:hypothetical protein